MVRLGADSVVLVAPARCQARLLRKDLSRWFVYLKARLLRKDLSRWFVYLNEYAYSMARMHSRMHASMHYVRMYLCMH